MTSKEEKFLEETFVVFDMIKTTKAYLFAKLLKHCQTQEFLPVKIGNFQSLVKFLFITKHMTILNLNNKIDFEPILLRKSRTLLVT